MTAGYTKLDIDPADLDPDGIAENQTTAGAGNLTLNGALCDLGTAGQFDIGDAYSSGVGGVKLLIDSAGDVSGVTFTITGKDQNGRSITEDVTGVTTTAVSTTKYYSQVTNIAVDGAVGSNVFVGTVTGELATKTIPVNRYSDNGANYQVSGKTGTCQFDILQSFDPVSDPDAMTWLTIQADKTADLSGTATPGATALKLQFDSYSNGAELQFDVRYNPYR